MPNDVEEQVIESNIDNELRSEISQVKKPSNMWIYIGAAVLGVIVIGLLVYFLAFANSKSTFTFYLNNTPVTENLNVKITFDNTTDEFVTTGSTLILPSFPKDEKFTLEVASYNFKKDFIGGLEEYRVDIKKVLELADNTPKPVTIKFSVYTSNDSFNVYSSPVTLSLKCLTSGKTDSIIVNGSNDYTKNSDCGALQINANVSGFTPYTGTCSEMYCSIKLSEVVTPPPVQTKNNLNVYVVDKEDNSPVKDVNVTVTRYGFTKTLTTDSFGEAEFVDLETGSYAVDAKVLHNDLVFSKTVASVNVETGTLASTTTITFDFSNNNKISLLIDANADLECQFGVDVIDSNSILQYSDALDANVNTSITFSDLNTGKYYMNIIPLGECLTVYSPIYNKLINYPQDSDLIIKMNAFDKTQLVLLNLKTRLSSSIYPGVSVKIADALDTNKIIIDTVSDEFGETPTIALYLDKNYIIKGETNIASVETSYKFTKTGHTADSDGYYNDTKDLVLKIDGVTLKIHADIFDDINTNFEVLASWTDYKGATQNIPFTGEQNLAELELPAGTDVLLKVSKDVLLEGSDETFKLNYYLNRFNFTKDISYDINVFLTQNYISSLYDTEKWYSEFSGDNYYSDFTLKSTSVVKENKLAGNKEYFVPFDVIPERYTDEFQSTCISSNKNGLGFLFSAGVSNQNILEVNDILAYTNLPALHSTNGFDFKPVFVERTLSENEINIFRVLIDTKIKDLNNGTGYLIYNKTSDVVPNDYDKKIDFTITNKLATNEKSNQYYFMDLNLFMPNATQVTLPIDAYIKLKLKQDSIYKVSNVNWFARNTLSECDPFVNNVQETVDMLDLIEPFIDKVIDEDGVVNVIIKPDVSSKNFNLPLKLDLGLTTTIKDNADKETSYNMNVTLKLNRGDYPQPSCLDILLDDQLLKSKNVLENNTFVGYYNNVPITSMTLPDLDLNNEQKALINQIFGNLDISNLIFMYYSVMVNGLIAIIDVAAAQGLDLSSYLQSLNLPSSYVINYDLVLTKPQKVEFVNHCSYWDFNVGYGLANTDVIFNSDKLNYKTDIKYDDGRSIVPKKYVANLDLNYNNYQFFSFYNNKDSNTPEQVKVHSSSFAFIPLPINKTLELPKDFNTAIQVGEIIPLETKYINPDCTTKMCGAELLDIFLKLNPNKQGSVNLLQDYIVVDSDTYHYVGFGKYDYDTMQNPWVIAKTSLLSDQLFYYLPIKNSGHSENYSKPIGSCLVNGDLVNYGSLQYAECTDNGINANRKIIYDTNSLTQVNDIRYNKLSTAFTSILFTSTSLGAALYVTPGIKYNICTGRDTSKCISDINKYDFISGNSKLNLNYFVYAGGNYYLPSQMFVYIDGNIYPRSEGIYSIVSFTKANNSTPGVPTNMNTNYSLLTNTINGHYDLSKVVENFNNGSIGYYYDSINKKYYYNWDLSNMFKSNTLPIIIRTAGHILSNNTAPIFNHSNIGLTVFTRMEDDQTGQNNQVNNNNIIITNLVNTMPNSNLGSIVNTQMNQLNNPNPAPGPSPVQTGTVLNR